MIKVDVIGFEELNSSKGTFYKVYAVSKEENKRGKGFKAVECFVDASHLKKHDKQPGTLIGSTADYYNVKDGNVWKSGLTFKNS